ncbi:hypothetical protein GGI42DRAFT_263301 [Trichoderma sp. SZMC 28013]
MIRLRTMAYIDRRPVGYSHIAKMSILVVAAFFCLVTSINFHPSWRSLYILQPSCRIKQSLLAARRIIPLIKLLNFNKSFASKALSKRYSDQPWSDFVTTSPLLMIGAFSALESKHSCLTPCRDNRDNVTRSICYCSQQSSLGPRNNNQRHYTSTDTDSPD